MTGQDRRVILLLTALALLALSCEPPPEERVLVGTCSPAIEPFVVNDARLTVDESGRLRDHYGREVVLRGLNTGGRSKFEPFLPFDVQADINLDELRIAADAYFAPMVDWGLDTVRMPFSWEALEPSPGDIDETYLDRYEVLVDAAWALGLRVIIDFHQDIYASPFCGDGFPPWTIADLSDTPPRHDCPNWFMAYFDDDNVREAFDRFWADENGVQSAMFNMWTVMALRFADHPGVFGFELINEPFAGSSAGAGEAQWKREVLEPFYEALALRLREIAPEVLIFYDSTGTDASNPVDAVHPRPPGSDWVFAPHYYDGSLLMGIGWLGTTPEASLETFAHFRDEQRTPVLLGEFGYPDGVDGGNEWLSLVMDGLDEHRLSATLWEYSLSDELWNEEDLSVVDPDGTERAILDAYVRPHLRALAGLNPTLRWSPEERELRATWIADAGVSELVLPRRIFPDGPTEVLLEGDGACWTPRSEGGVIQIQAPPGRAITLTVR